MPAHPIFKRFTGFEGWAEPGFEFGFYGVNIRDWLFAGESKGLNTRRFVQVHHLPPVDEEYFEWIALLTAVAHARGRFCMAEIGAGWGRWIASAVMLCRQRSLDFALIAVEPEPSHFDWMKMVLADNQVDPDRHRLVLGAVVDRPGEVILTGADPRTNYGHKTITATELPAWQNLPGYTFQKVQALTLASSLSGHQVVDLVDMDVQGAEGAIVTNSMQALDEKVKIVHIGTHAHDIEADIERAFSSHGWLNAFLFPCQTETETLYGRVAFGDGVQTWVNPRWPALHTALVEVVP